MSRYIVTYTGKKFDPLEPNIEDIDIIDISHALSFVNRYAGHSKFPYSVALHSMMVSDMCSSEHALAGLLHDASEAYLGDICRPMKVTNVFAEYRKVEAHLQALIYKKFDVPYTYVPTAVKYADNVAFMLEFKNIMPKIDISDGTIPRESLPLWAANMFRDWKWERNQKDVEADFLLMFDIYYARMKMTKEKECV